MPPGRRRRRSPWLPAGVPGPPRTRRPAATWWSRRRRPGSRWARRCQARKDLLRLPSHRQCRTGRPRPCRPRAGPAACEHGGVERPDTRQIWNANAAAWTELSRGGFDRYRDLVNGPAFFGLLPPVDGLLCLDLGCGEGHNTRLLAGRGARVVALDVAELFIAAAVGEDRRGIRYLVGDGAVLPFRASAFDVV